MTPSPKFGDRVKDLRKRDYGEGVIVGFVSDGADYYVIRWDDSGLDNEWLVINEAGIRQFEIIETKYCQCGHEDGAHFDGMMEYQACLYEWCKCMKYKTREV